MSYAGRMANQHIDRQPTVGDLYPDITANELSTAEDNLKRYLSVVLRIWERIRTDPEEYARFKALTAPRRNP